MISVVIPEAAQRLSGIHSPGGYGFRARAFRAPRNDAEFVVGDIGS